MARRSYTEQERREVLADVPTLAVKAAASRHWVSPTTVQSWIDRGRSSKTVVSTMTPPRAPTRSGAAAAKHARRQYSEDEKREVMADALAPRKPLAISCST